MTPSPSAQDRGMFAKALTCTIQRQTLAPSGYAVHSDEFIKDYFPEFGVVGATYFNDGILPLLHDAICFYW